MDLTTGLQAKCIPSFLCLIICPFAEVIKEKGLEHVTVEDLVVEITPKGRGSN